VVQAKNSFAPIEAGEYHVKLEKYEVGENRDMLPAIKCAFRMGNNRLIFNDMSLQLASYPDMTAMLIAQANDFTNDLVGEDVEFTSLGELAGRVEKAPIGESFKVEVYYTKQNPDKFPKVKIIEKLEDVPF